MKRLLPLRATRGIGPDFRTLWAASATSNLADGVNLAAAPLLAASLTRDPALVAGLTVAQRLPWFLFSLLTGALADRWDRRRALRAANALRAATLLGLGLLQAAGGMSLPLLYGAFFLLGVAETLYDNASFAILPSVVPRPELERANGRLFATTTVLNEFVGPPLGGLLFAGVVAAPFLLAGGAYAASAALLLLLRGSFRAAGRDARASARAGGGFVREIREGLGWFFRHELLRTLGWMAAASNLVWAATAGVLVLFAQERLGLSGVGYGLLLAASAVGGIAGSVAVGRVTKRVPAGTLILATNLLLAGSYVGVAFSRHALLVGGLLAFVSLVSILQNVVLVSLRQTLVPDALLGRVTSAYRMLALGAMPVGGAAGGLLAKHVGLPAPFVAGGALLALMSVSILPVVNDRRIAVERAAGEARSSS